MGHGGNSVLHTDFEKVTDTGGSVRDLAEDQSLSRMGRGSKVIKGLLEGLSHAKG